MKTLPVSSYMTLFVILKNTLKRASEPMVACIRRNGAIVHNYKMDRKVLAKYTRQL